MLCKDFTGKKEARSKNYMLHIYFMKNIQLKEVDY